MNLKNLANPHILNLHPYQPGKPIESLERELGIKSAIKLASNENPFGASLKALEAASLALKQMHIYPDGSAFEIKEAISQQFNVDKTFITIGNGSENVLELIIKTFLSSETNAIISQYAFLTIPLLLQSYNVPTKVIPAIDWSHDLHGMLSAIDHKTKMIFLVNPNNPTGTYVSFQEVKYFISQVPSTVLVVIDEAYYDYIYDEDPWDRINLINQYPNLIITRTFSKAYGLAALRIGFSFSNPIIADLLNRVRLPFNVNAIAMKAACAALCDENHLKQSIQMNKEGKAFLEKELSQLNIHFIPSKANFITLNVWDGEWVYQTLLKKGVIVRPLIAYQMPAFIRVTISQAENNQRFLKALMQTLSSKNFIESAISI